jgi:hypothetical protein
MVDREHAGEVERGERARKGIGCTHEKTYLEKYEVPDLEKYRSDQPSQQTMPRTFWRKHHRKIVPLLPAALL